MYAYTSIYFLSKPHPPTFLFYTVTYSQRHSQQGHHQAKESDSHLILVFYRKTTPILLFMFKGENEVLILLAKKNI